MIKSSAVRKFKVSSLLTLVALAAAALPSAASADPGASASKALKDWLSAQALTQFQSATLINNAGVIPTIGPLSQADPYNLAMALRV